jgi:hypothetical protein
MAKDVIMRDLCPAVTLTVPSYIIRYGLLTELFSGNPHMARAKLRSDDRHHHIADEHQSATPNQHATSGG